MPVSLVTSPVAGRPEKRTTAPPSGFLVAVSVTMPRTVPSTGGRITSRVSVTTLVRRSTCGIGS